MHGTPLLMSQAPDPMNCLRAIELIPGGLRPLDADFLQRTGIPDPTRPITVEVDKRFGGYRPPAIFHSVDCDISVDVHNLDENTPSVTVTGGFMFMQFWPVVKRAAKEIVNRCVAGLQVEGQVLRVNGQYDWSFTVDGHHFGGFVRVRYRAPGNWPRAPTGNVNVFDAAKAPPPGPKRPPHDDSNIDVAAKRLKPT